MRKPLRPPGEGGGDGYSNPWEDLREISVSGVSGSEMNSPMDELPLVSLLHRAIKEMSDAEVRFHGTHSFLLAHPVWLACTEEK